MPDRMRIISLSLGLAILLGLVGCINPRTQVELYYPSRLAQHKLYLPLQVPSEGQRPSLEVAPVEDLRPWSRVGGIRSDWDFHVRVIEASNSVPEWFQSGLAQGLEQQGYPPRGQEPARVSVECKLRELFVAKRFFYEAQLKVFLVARCTCHQKVLVSKEIEQAFSLEDQPEASHAEALAGLLVHATERIANELAHLRNSDLHRTPRPTLVALDPDE